MKACKLVTMQQPCLLLWLLLKPSDMSPACEVHTLYKLNEDIIREIKSSDMMIIWMI
jgi:hypothetical protein